MEATESPVVQPCCLSDLSYNPAYPLISCLCDFGPRGFFGASACSGSKPGPSYKLLIIREPVNIIVSETSRLAEQKSNARHGHKELGVILAIRCLGEFKLRCDSSLHPSISQVSLDSMSYQLSAYTSPSVSNMA